MGFSAPLFHFTRLRALLFCTIHQFRGRAQLRRALGGRTFLIRKCHQMRPGELWAPVAQPQPCFKIPGKFLKIRVTQGYMENYVPMYLHAFNISNKSYMCFPPCIWPSYMSTQRIWLCHSCRRLTLME